MSSNINKYFKYIDIIRVISCIAVLLYHFNILKGGYLAVCTFFVLTGYLSSVSALKKENFSLMQYYKNKFKRLYLPLIIVVFLTIAITSFIKNLTWLNLKVETTSILFGYNNFWQLNANLDYFARHINSPFMHLWYISILIQFDLIFPFIFLSLKKLGQKFNKLVPIIILIIISIIGTIYFYQSSISQNIMVTYYNSFTRLFSIFYGICLAFIHDNYSEFKNNNNLLNKFIFIFYLLILIFLFVFIDADSKYFAISMIISSLITCRLIKYCTLITSSKITFIDKIVKFLSNISYEIYLVQYPIIFLFQYINLNFYMSILLMIIVILIVSYILNLVTNLKNKNIVIKILLVSIISISSLFGLYKFIMAKDYSKEMKNLEKQLENNEKIFQDKQLLFEEQYKQNEIDLLNSLKELENEEKDLENIITNLSIVGVGDSVMLGALDNLYKKFPNGYFDAKKSRTAWVVNDILVSLKKKNILGNPIVINMGANGDAPMNVKEKIMETIGDRDVFWVNVANNFNKYVNDNLNKFAENYDNLHIIDWNSISSGHSEYFIADKIHLSNEGRIAYTNAIYESIYKVYLDKYVKRKDELIKDYEDNLNNKITFIGNNVLLNAYNMLQNDFANDNYIIKNNYTEILVALKNDISSKNIVFAFDDTFNLSKSEYMELINLCKNKNIYVVSFSKKSIDILKEIKLENVTNINFYNTLKDHDEYYMIDKIHLNDLGNKELNNILNSHLKQNKN